MSMTTKQLRMAGIRLCVAQIAMLLLAIGSTSALSAVMSHSSDHEPNVVFEGAGRWEYAGGGQHQRRILYGLSARLGSWRFALEND